MIFHFINDLYLGMANASSETRPDGRAACSIVGFTLLKRFVIRRTVAWVLVQRKERDMVSSKYRLSWRQSLKAAIGLSTLLSLLGGTAGDIHANAIVVGHDINTLGTSVAGNSEATFAVNIANFLTSGSATKNLLLFESNPGDGTRDFDIDVSNALTGAGFKVTSIYTHPLRVLTPFLSRKTIRRWAF
jgi:hypothetical protein